MRQHIVEGAVGMGEMALQQLSELKVVELDEQRWATWGNNLLVAPVPYRVTPPFARNRVNSLRRLKV